ncbi:PTS sugar transporter subunit IIA [Vagococcus carniphilus]|uniref:Ascorbate-specific PTS system EIIA component n=1 Tax=Vagococcus carniphilus TaxID=218144 RepID=A0AAW8U451_9ENTE|nr:PTS sugar transporter subunit IIA [Vagococcus carniphilus]MDT2815577.1 PTS sugar transporter subunit IIA [Vagococcus carniphilus]MDT2830789.1 PTS sugar transporter subunit IIA [Vagococcus carniphilus]MDT2833092.1 PTS sugar transporter subunit IIA [Vagococcus carniphilus]MDT2839439.1 PTS sugar transporter subunit IIA [Vagococcus carniphilus]MDT2848542.1 PTS sugar transporter subunit IIA [Vagococcus carniphilus]
MLKYFFENDLINYSDKDITDWQEAISESCQVLLKKEIINQSYIDEIIDCVKEHGPYIVIVPEVAMPHSSEKSEGVFGTAISFTKMKSEIVFDDPTEEKKAVLFFTLAAKNSEEHMENIQNLSELLMTEGLIEDLVRTNSLEDYVEVMEKYSN